MSTLLVLFLDVQSSTLCHLSGSLKMLKEIDSCRCINGDLTFGQGTDTRWTSSRKIREIRGCLSIENSRLKNLAFLDPGARPFKREYNCTDGRLPMVIVNNNTPLLQEETNLEETVQDLSPGKVLIRLGKDCRHLDNVPITPLTMLTNCDRFYGLFRPAFPQPLLDYRLEMTLVGCLTVSRTNLKNLDWLEKVEHSRRDCPTGHSVENNPKLYQNLDKDWSCPDVSAISNSNRMEESNF